VAPEADVIGTGNRTGTAEGAIFKALADPTRRQILQQLRKAELPAGELSSRFPISGPSVSRHLAVLKSAGLVRERRQANRILYSLVPERLAATLRSYLASVSADDVLRPERAKKKPKPIGKDAVKKDSGKKDSGKKDAVKTTKAKHKAAKTKAAEMAEIEGSARSLPTPTATPTP
jgi:DNA-binding transcriptional ArsR family regulator